MLKRILCALLALLAIVGNLPGIAFAAETEELETLHSKIDYVHPSGNSVGRAATLQQSPLFEYYYAESVASESEKNNSRSTANALPVSSYDHIAVQGSINSKKDSKDYYKFKVTETMYLKLLVLSAHPWKHSQFSLYDSDGDKLKSASYKEKLTSDKDTLYFMEYSLNPGTYYLRAYEPKKSGYSSIGSEYIMILHLFPRLAKPSLSASNDKSTGKPILTWDAVEGAQYYKVFRATSKSGTYYEKAVVYDTTWTDTAAKAGKTYYYKVQAFSDSSYYNESNNESSKSSYKAKPCDCPRPEVEIKLKKGKPRLTWDEVSGAVQYKVYRATSEDGTYKCIKTTKSTSFTDSSAKAKKTYYYKVMACAKKESCNSAKSYVVSIKATK